MSPHTIQQVKYIVKMANKVILKKRSHKHKLIEKIDRK